MLFGGSIFFNHPFPDGTSKTVLKDCDAKKLTKAFFEESCIKIYNFE